MLSSTEPLAPWSFEQEPHAGEAIGNAPLSQRDVLALLEEGDGHHPRRPLILTRQIHPNERRVKINLVETLANRPFRAGPSPRAKKSVLL